MFKFPLLFAVLLIVSVNSQLDDRLTDEEIRELKSAYSQPRVENRLGFVRFVSVYFFIEPLNLHAFDEMLF